MTALALARAPIAFDAGLARLAGAGIGVTAFVALLPTSMIPSGLPLAAMLIASLVMVLARGGEFMPRSDPVLLTSILFTGVGVLYMALSAMDIIQGGPLRPRRYDFLLRHSYFFVLWLPLLLGGTALVAALIPTLPARLRWAALPVLALLAAADLVTAVVLGDPATASEGYVAFLDAPTITFLYALCFLFHAAACRQILWPLIIVVAHFAVASVFDIGMMFTTLTGSFVFVVLVAFALTMWRGAPRKALYLVALLGGLLLFGLAVGALLPTLAGGDLNSQWRFMVWRENLFAAIESGFVGVGFGVPYFPVSGANIAEAVRLTSTPAFAVYAQTSPIEILYVRGQHSSLVNAFYRTGLIGGLLLILFNLAVIATAMRAAARATGKDAALYAAAGALFIIELTQTAMHVGLESPRYFTWYMLAVCIVRGAVRAGTRP